MCCVQVVRETSNSNSNSTEQIEIPPPRPKRKPSHPYPRKLVLPSKKGMPMDQRARSESPNSSVPEQENQSPTSVLSAVASDTLASADSATPKSSPSPVSSGNFADRVTVFPCEDNAPKPLQFTSASVVLKLSFTCVEVSVLFNCCFCIHLMYWIHRNWSFFRTRSYLTRKI